MKFLYFSFWSFWSIEFETECFLLLDDILCIKVETQIKIIIRWKIITELESYH